MASDRHGPLATHAIVPLPAEVDCASASSVSAQLGAAQVPGVTTVIVDMTATTFCDSSGVTALATACSQAAAAGIELRVVTRSPAIRRVFALTGADQYFAIYPDLPAALAPGS